MTLPFLSIYRFSCHLGALNFAFQERSVVADFVSKNDVVEMHGESAEILLLCLGYNIVVKCSYMSFLNCHF